MMGMKRWRRRPSARPTRGAEFVMAEAAINWQPLGAVSADPLWPCSLSSWPYTRAACGTQPGQTGEERSPSVGNVVQGLEQKGYKNSARRILAAHKILCVGVKSFSNTGR